mmetsp:Transcript_22997/g.40618  ORF Transcript_22997/g.40618 Transcript_22997/m.40618 type:complete len:544 (-) Transcript_22997:17-1648(-)
MLTALLSRAHNQGVGLRQLFQALDQLGQVLAILCLHSHLHNRGHAVLHVSDVVGILQRGDGSGLQDVLVHSDQRHGVATWHILDLLCRSAHHQHCSLDVLHVQVLLGARLVVRSLDAHLLACGDGAREHSPEGIEAALVGGGHHLGHVHHQGASRIARADAVGGRIIHGALVQVLHSVLLGCSRGRQLGDNHCQQCVGGIDPDLHCALHQRLTSQRLLVALQHNAQGAHHLLVLLLVIVHDGPHQLINGSHDELAESTLQRLCAPFWLLHVGPDLLLGIEERISPHPLHHLLLLHAHLRGIDLGETLRSKTPSMQTTAECNGALLRCHLHIAHQRIVVGGNDHVHVLNGISEPGVHVLCLHLQLKDAAVHLVDKQARPNTLLQRLTQHGLRLHSTTFNAVNHHHGSVGDSQGCRHLRGEVNVARRIDQIDQVGNRALAILFVMLEIQGHPCALDCHTSLLFICPGVSEASITCSFGRDDSRLADQRVSQGGLAVIHVCNHTHGADVIRLIHDGAHLVHGEVRHGCEWLSRDPSFYVAAPRSAA